MMVTIPSQSEFLGIGIYSAAEAAFYARIQTRTINRWIFGNKQGRQVVTPQLVSDDQKFVTFLDFIQALAIREIRSRHDVDLEKIRQAVELAENRGIRYPFAQRHSAFLFGDNIALEIDGQLIQASGDGRKNLLMKEIAQLYLKDLYFSTESGLACRYVAWRDENGQIVMNPQFRFGEPVVENCGYTAQTLWEAYEIEGGINAAADAYNVKPGDVEIALRYHDHLLNSSAA